MRGYSNRKPKEGCVTAVILDNVKNLNKLQQPQAEIWSIV